MSWNWGEFKRSNLGKLRYQDLWPVMARVSIRSGTAGFSYSNDTVYFTQQCLLQCVPDVLGLGHSAVPSIRVDQPEGYLL